MGTPKAAAPRGGVAQAPKFHMHDKICSRGVPAAVVTIVTKLFHVLHRV